MRITLTEEQKAHCRALGIEIVPDVLDVADHEWRRAVGLWKRVGSDIDHELKAVGHLAWEKCREVASESEAFVQEEVQKVEAIPVSMKLVERLLGFIAFLILLLLIVTAFSGRAHAQWSQIKTITFQNSDNSVAGLAAGPFTIRPSSGTWSRSGTTWTLTVTAASGSVAWDAITNPLGGGVTLTQFANGNTFLTVKRKTDTTPTGAFFDFQNAVGSSLCKLDITGAFVGCSFPYANLTGAPTLPANTTSTGSQWFSAYNSATGAYTKSQPAFGDISGTATTAQLPGTGATTVNGVACTLGSTCTVADSTKVPTTRAVNGKALSADITLGLASSDFANQGTTTTVLHGNGAGNPAFGGIVIADIIDKLGTGTKVATTSATAPASAKCTEMDTNGNIVIAASNAACGSGGSGMTNPMTTLGDIIYEDVTPTAVRLAGNTTTTKKYLSQTGNGTISAVPAWAQVAYADISGTPTLAATKTAASGQPLLSYDSATGLFTQGALTATNVGLGSVTNDAQTKAAIVPNTAPSAGQLLIGNAGGTAYAPLSISQDCTIASTGAITCTKTNNVSFAASATTDATNASNIASGTLLAARMPALTGDVTSTVNTVATTVGKINGVSLAGLATGILKNTTTTGVPSIAVAGDFPTLNQNTSGTAANLSGTPALPNGTTATTQSALDNSTKLATTAYADASLKSQYKIWTCETGLGDGLNAVTAGTYLQSFCFNTTGVTVTLTAVKCYTDNAGSSTLNAAGNTLGALLTGAVTCSSTIASGTQSGNVLLTNGDYVKFTWVADGTSKQSTWVVTGTF